MSQIRGPGEEISLEVLGADAFFERIGDLLEAHELRALDLREPENLLSRVEYLADLGEFNR